MSKEVDFRGEDVRYADVRWRVVFTTHHLNSGIF